MRVMTYNVHSCIDTDRKNSLPRVVQLIKQEKIAVAGLNEIETFSPRTWFANQPKRLAQALDMVYCYGPTIRLGRTGFFGNAVLSRYPIVEHRNIKLPGVKIREPRCCLKAVLGVKGGYLTVLTTHLGLDAADRKDQIKELARLVKAEKNPVILMGDFNCGTGELEPVYEVMTDGGAGFGTGFTYPADNPAHRIDYIFISPPITCSHIYIPDCDASDHLPVVADLQLP